MAGMEIRHVKYPPETISMGLSQVTSWSPHLATYTTPRDLFAAVTNQVPTEEKEVVQLNLKYFLIQLGYMPLIPTLRRQNEFEFEASLICIGSFKN